MTAKGEDRSGQLHITVGTHPSGKVDLTPDLRLTKAAMLYADRVELYSLTASLLFAWQAIEDYDLSERALFIAKVMPFFSSSRDAKQFAKFLRQHKAELYKPPFKETLETSWQDLCEAGQTLWDNAKLSEMQKAVRSGRVELHPFYGFTDRKLATEFLADFMAFTSEKPAAKRRRSQFERREDEVIREFVEGIFAAVTDGVTHPLFDAGVGRLVQSAVREGKIDVSHAASLRGRHTALASHLLSRLPLFDEATVDEVLDIRSELEAPLIKFRAAMLQYSESVKSAAWEHGFPEEAEIIFHREVAPAVQEIEDAVASNSFLAKLARRAIDRPITIPAGSCLSILLSSMSDLPQALAWGLGLGASASALLYDVYGEWKSERRKVEGSNLYFYYETGRRLS